MNPELRADCLAMKQSSKARLPGIPSLAGTHFVGVLPRLLRDPLSLYGEATAMGAIVRLRLPLSPAYFISSPELIQDVMQKRAQMRSLTQL